MSIYKYGTDPHKLARTDDPETSHEAAEKVDSATWEQRVHKWVTSTGLSGGTPTEARAYYSDVPYSTIGARFAALKRKGFIVTNGEKREGSAVLIDAKYLVDEHGQGCMF